MKIEEAANTLDKTLREQYNNIQAVAILHGKTLEVYTITKPIKRQLELIEFNGFKVTWRRTGQIKPAFVNKDGSDF